MVDIDLRVSLCIRLSRPGVKAFWDAAASLTLLAESNGPRSEKQNI
jgi:hypothetical protein